MIGCPFLVKGEHRRTAFDAKDRRGFNRDVKLAAKVTPATHRVFLSEDESVAKKKKAAKPAKKAAKKKKK